MMRSTCPVAHTSATRRTLITSALLCILLGSLPQGRCQGSGKPCEEHDTPKSGANSALCLHSGAQQHQQSQTAAVLKAVAQGSISLTNAVDLLEQVIVLRTSLQSGAAAARWQALKPVQQAEQEQQQQQQQQGPDATSSGPHDDSAANSQQSPPRTPSRGILVVAGGNHQFRNAFILLRLLSHPDIACTLPVELVYYGPQEYDAAAAAAMQQHAGSAGIPLKFIDGSGVAPSGSVGLEPHQPPGRVTSFKAKVHALVWVTSFDQVLLLDSDNTPLTDPTPLFDSAVFKAHGSIFWPDFWTNQWMQPALYSLLGMDIPWEVNPGFRASEAGQAVIDRVRHHDVLEYLWLLNTHSNSGIPGAQQGVVGQCLWGDKDTYPIAFHLAGKARDFYSVQHNPLQALSRPGGSNTARLVHAGMVHRAPWGSGPLMWLHRTAAGKFWPHCAVHGGAPCRVWAVTTPVDQRQLLATVRDPSAMELSVEQVDMVWRKQHCTVGTTEGLEECSTGQCLADNSQQEPVYSNATALPCDLEQSVGLLPIPVIRTNHLLSQVKNLLKAAQEAFTDSRLIRAA